MGVAAARVFVFYALSQCAREVLCLFLGRSYSLFVPPLMLVLWFAETTTSVENVLELPRGPSVELSRFLCDVVCFDLLIRLVLVRVLSFLPFSHLVPLSVRFNSFGFDSVRLCTSVFFVFVCPFFVMWCARSCFFPELILGSSLCLLFPCARPALLSSAKSCT